VDVLTLGELACGYVFVAAAWRRPAFRARASTASPGAASIRRPLVPSSACWASSPDDLPELFLTNEQLGLTSQLACRGRRHPRLRPLWYIVTKIVRRNASIDVAYAFGVPPE
jgi:hypothetical protein